MCVNRLQGNWRQTCLSAVRTSAGIAQHSVQVPQVAADKFGLMHSPSNSASNFRCPAESSLSAAARPPDPVPGFCSLFLYRRYAYMLARAFVMIATSIINPLTHFSEIFGVCVIIECHNTNMKRRKIWAGVVSHL